MPLVPDGPRERPMIPVEPALRPVRHRNASRVVIRSGERVLVVADTDPGVPGSHWYVLPGGGWDPAESSREAAVRELAEETGLSVHADDLVGPVAHRIVSHGYSDQVLVQYEDFYVLDLPSAFEPDVSGFTAEEQLTLGEFRWVTTEQLSTLVVWPLEVPELMVADGTVDRDLGEPEESTVPLSKGHR